MSEIKYWMPIQKAWDKMVHVLFRPFDFGKWMVIGFAAFLANCGRDSGGGGGSGSGNLSGRSHDGSGADFRSGLLTLKETIADAWYEYTVLIIIISIAVLILIIFLSILVNWLNSRGQFMFLDNVVKNRGAVSEPWNEYSKEANSLMIFQLLFNWISGIFVLILLAGLLIPVFSMIMMERFVGAGLGVIVGSIVLLVVISIVCAFVGMILNRFVVPLMYKRRLSVLEGFRAFSPLLKEHFWRLILFGLLMILVGVATGMAVLIGILLTCCTAFLLLIIPYIGTVVLLPLYVFQRFIGLEFLRQFGDEYDLLSDFAVSQEETNPEI